MRLMQGKFEGEKSKLAPREIARYSRQIQLAEVGLEGQRKLKASRVLMIGAGGLGSPAGLYLTAAGVGTIGIADFDAVEVHNLHRQVIHHSSSIGQKKTESAEARLRELNPDLRVVRHDSGVTPENAVELFRQYDVIVDGADNFPTRYLDNDAAFFAGKPLVYGSIFQFEGQVSLFHSAGGGPCYRCLFPKPPAPGTVPNCAEGGVLGPLCGVIGSLQAMEAIKFLLGAGDSLRERLLVFDALRGEFRKIQIRRDPSCPLCGERPSITTIEPGQYGQACDANGVGDACHSAAPDEIPLEIDILAARRILEGDRDAVLLDVREPFETEICSIPGSRAIPMREIPDHLDTLSRGKTLLVYCHHGGRSRQVTAFLRQHGYVRATNIAGGIDAWAREFDPSMPRY